MSNNLLQEFPTRISCEVNANWVSVVHIYEGAQLYDDKNTKFKQGNLGDCWLAAAIESLRHDNNKQAFEKVVQGELTYKFWQEGDYNREIILQSNAIPVNDAGEPEFMRSIDGTEYWGILLEKAYAKWVGSYEGLTGGFWSDAMQSFTGGVIERIKLQDRAPENLFNIMLQSFQNGSSLCCIIKKDINEQEMERYHTCCCISIEEGASKVMIRDPYVISDCHEMTFSEFVNEYHRLDICHSNLDNFKEFQRKNISPGEWQENIIKLKEGKNELSIELTETDDDGEGCSFLIEVIQTLKPDGQLGLWQKAKEIEVNYEDKMEFIKYPQQAFPFIVPQGNYSITFRDTPPDAFVRVFSKKHYPVQLN
ncbi:hypothetical protein L9F63_004581 [Diploptera punctata]|uniref:Calpain catalytic domain-containing protein n=1 Tax=Diploptera punctata TaxID=6984 RepID=A0AAD7ZFP3_DIPPU|nr:hypothetical protein L9F63_004581 [Diploptera punctata]